MRMTVSVLGTIYNVIDGNEETCPQLAECDGFTDTTTKTITVNDMSRFDGAEGYVGDANAVRRRVKRHEVIHAFFEESGLATESEFARNEELVDWIALQFPKIARAFAELGILEVET